MAGGMDLGGGGKKGKKALDVSINLVPFIDLMAVTIVFLIMTAVWTQLGRLQVSQAGQNASEEQQQDPNKLQPITLLITEKELKLTVGGSQLDPIPVVRDNGRLDVTQLVIKLKDLKQQQPEQPAITLQTEDGVIYEDLVRLIDTCIGGKTAETQLFPSISVSPASAS